MTSPVEILDATCEGCLDKAHDKTYDLAAQCRNCGERFIVRWTRGHMPHSFIPCAYCGLMMLTYGSAAEARVLLASQGSTDATTLIAAAERAETREEYGRDSSV